MLQQLHLIWFCLRICLEGVRICLQGIRICIKGINPQDFCLSIHVEGRGLKVPILRWIPPRCADALLDGSS